MYTNVHPGSLYYVRPNTDVPFQKLYMLMGKRYTPLQVSKVPNPRPIQMSGNKPDGVPRHLLFGPSFFPRWRYIPPVLSTYSSPLKFSSKFLTLVRNQELISSHRHCFIFMCNFQLFLWRVY